MRHSPGLLQAQAAVDSPSAAVSGFAARTVSEKRRNVADSGASKEDTLDAAWIEDEFETPAHGQRRRNSIEHIADENKIRANAWISECAPKTWLLEQERPVWMQTKLWLQRERKSRKEMYRNMPTMPFDLWLQMKQGLEASALRQGPQRKVTVMSPEDTKKKPFPRLEQSDSPHGGAKPVQPMSPLSDGEGGTDAAQPDEQEMRQHFQSIALSRRSPAKARPRNL